MNVVGNVNYNDDYDYDDDDIPPTLVLLQSNSIINNDDTNSMRSTETATVTTAATTSTVEVDNDDEIPLTLVETTLTSLETLQDSTVNVNEVNNTSTSTKNADIDKQSTLVPKQNSSRNNTCPITILTGFLGSGKSTLINYILHSPNHGKRIAVIENEFGNSNTTSNSSESDIENKQVTIESIITQDDRIYDKNSDMKQNSSFPINIPNDTSTAVSSSGSNSSSLVDFVELPNGCVCCTVKDSLVIALETLLSSSKHSTSIDHIIIECSGLANPGPIASIFWLDDNADANDTNTNNDTTDDSNEIHKKRQLVLDGIVTVVDCYNIVHQINTTIEAAQQVAYADRIILNKIDLLSQPLPVPVDRNQQQQRMQQQHHIHHHDNIDTIVQVIQSINPTVPMQTTTYSSIPDLDFILNTSSYTSSNISTSLPLSTSNSKRIQSHLPLDPTNFCTEAFMEETATTDHNNNKNKNITTTKGDDCSKPMTILPWMIPTSSSVATYVPKLLLPPKTHTHTSAITTVTVSIIGTVHLHLVNQWIASILWPNQDEYNTILQQKFHSINSTTTATLPSEIPTTPTSTSTTDTTKTTTISNGGASPEEIESGNCDDVTESLVHEIFRMKGILSVCRGRDDIDDEDDDRNYANTTTTITANTNTDDKYIIDHRRYIVQGVYDLWDIHPCTNNQFIFHENEQRISTIIIIGKNLNHSLLQKGFESCKITI